MIIRPPPGGGGGVIGEEEYDFEAAEDEAECGFDDIGLGTPEAPTDA